jgi:hypothetical protein
MDVAVRTETAPGSQPRAARARRVLSAGADCLYAAAALADGQVVGHGFANFYALTARADRASVRRVNLLKGRPESQVGSVTVSPSRIADVFDWSLLPAGLTRRRTLALVDALYQLGPFGFRGPAADHVPEHLSSFDGPVRTVQVIAPGYSCVSNDFLARCLDLADADLLYITSANRSRHLTGADDTPAHWRAAGLREEFGQEEDFVLLEHEDEDVVRIRYPQFQPMSTTILDLHRLGAADPNDPRPQLILNRHGSLHQDVVRSVLDRLGFGMVLGGKAQTRLSLREYPQSR